MRRILIFVLAAALVAGPAPITKAEHQRGPCRIHWKFKPRPEHREDIHRAVRRLIRCSVRRWSVSGGASKALEVARCESGFWPWAVGGDNLGVYQHKDDYWASRAHRYLRRVWFDGRKFPNAEHPSRLAFNARANVLVSIRMAHAGGWGPWACA